MRLLKSSLTFYFLVLAVSVTLAQQQTLDSLRNVINSNAPGPEKIKAYLALSAAVNFKDFEECLLVSGSGAALAQKLGDLPSLGKFQKTIGISYYFKGNFDSAASYYYKALDVLKKDKDPVERAAVLNELGKLYRKTKDLGRSLQMYDEAYAIYKSIGSEDGMATILNESGVVFEYKGDYEEAIRRYKSSLTIREKMNDIVGKAYSLNFIGGVYTQEGNFPEAEKYLMQSLDLRRQLKDTFSIAFNLADLGFMYTQQNRLDKAVEQYQLSNDIAVKMKFPDLLLENYKELSVIAEKKGDPLLSLEYYKKHIALKDSLFAGEKMKQIEQLNAKYQAEKKEQLLAVQKAEITQKNYLLWGLTAVVALLVLSGISFYRKRRIQQEMKLQAAIMKQQEMATRSVISAEENERKRIAADLHDGVGQMMSAAKMNLSAFENEIPFKDVSQKLAFEKILELVDESCREIRSVSHQMMPNALLKSGLANAVREFIDKIDNRIIKITLHAAGLQERLDSNVETVLYRVIQECVNNVIKHSGANALDISLIKDTDGIAATIEDNGNGFDTSDKEKFEGIGLKNIISRITFLKGTVEFDSSPGKGTLVAIHVPLT